MVRFDLESNTEDLVINDTTGDFTVRASDQAHIEDLIYANKGDYKQFPLRGAGVERYLNASGGKQSAKRVIITELEADNYRKIRVIIDGDDITIDAEPRN